MSTRSITIIAGGGLLPPSLQSMRRVMVKQIIWRAALLALGLVTLCQCNLARPVDRAENLRWDPAGFWKLAPGSQKDYVPKEYPGKPSRDQMAGEWINDPQDGTRFYVPVNGVGRYSAQIVRAEVIKAQNRYTLKQQKMVNTVKVLATPIHVATLGTLLLDWQNSSGSENWSTSDSDSAFPDTSTSDNHCDDRERGKGKDCDHDHRHSKDDDCRDDHKGR